MITKIEHTDSPLIPAAITLAHHQIICNEIEKNDILPSTNTAARAPPETKISEEDFLFDETYEDGISEGHNPTYHTTPNTRPPTIHRTRNPDANTNVPTILCKPHSKKEHTEAIVTIKVLPHTISLTRHYKLITDLQPITHPNGPLPGHIVYHIPPITEEIEKYTRTHGMCRPHPTIPFNLPPPIIATLANLYQITHERHTHPRCSPIIPRMIKTYYPIIGDKRKVTVSPGSGYELE